MPSESRPEHRLSRRQVVRLGAGLAGGAALTGRAPRASWAAPPAQDAPITVPDFTSSIEPKPVKLELWTFVDTHARWFTAMAEGYKAQVNPDFELNVVQTAYEDHHNKLLVSFQSGGVGAPDLADIEQGRFGAFIKGDIGLADLTEKLTSGGYLDQLVASREALYSVGQTVYGVEHALTPVVLYYRSDIYEGAGVTIPLATWEDFIAATKPLVKDNVKGISINWDVYDIVLRQRGFDTFDANGNVTADSPEAIETLQWLFALRDEHKIAAEPPAGAQAFGTAADQSWYAAVKEGQYVAIPGADWYAGFLKDNVADLAGKWKAQYLPAFAAGGARTSVWGGTGLCIVKTSDKQDAAWDFLRYSMLTKEGEVQQYLAIKLWPAFKPAWDDPRMYSADDYFGGQELGKLFAEVGAEAPAQYQSPYRADFNVLRRDKYTRDIFDGKLSPADGLKQLADEIRKMQQS
ncbi:MAG TPA: extracellular solute-binding protein [Thermomicrobiales bacterium]